MLSKICSLAVCGVEGVLIEVEVDLSSKMPNFLIVGLPDTAIREAKDRVKTSMINAGYLFPYKRILINLAPADIKKQGPQYDLPIALGLLAASEQIPCERLSKIAAIGELALDGSVKPIKGVISMVQALRSNGIGKIILPYGNRYEAAEFGQIEVYPVQNIAQAVNYFIAKEPVSPFTCEKKLPLQEEDVDYAEVAGQECGKRAMVVAAAGGHHCLLSGPPGSGKTMLARRITTILPRLSVKKSLETSRIYSVCGLLPSDQGLIFAPPFRDPHHTISSAGLAGGGSHPRPGEMSLAHNGVLFMDELPEFQRNTLEVLRQPLESGEIVIARARETVSYPARFLLIAAMNPCPCGYLGDILQACRCSPSAVARYRHRISGPLLDRFDIHIEVPRIQYDELIDNQARSSSVKLRKHVLNARKVQEQRLAKCKSILNGQMSAASIKQHCALDSHGKRLMRQAVDKLGLSARAYHKILKVARTIADLEGKKDIAPEHVGEAVQYRSLDRTPVLY